MTTTADGSGSSIWLIASDGNGSSPILSRSLCFRPPSLVSITRNLSFPPSLAILSHSMCFLRCRVLCTPAFWVASLRCFVRVNGVIASHSPPTRLQAASPSPPIRLPIATSSPSHSNPVPRRAHAGYVPAARDALRVRPLVKPRGATDAIDCHRLQSITIECC